MNDTSPSLELSEVSARFNEAEGMLQEARERLQAILLHEHRKEEAADSLTESARAVAEFTSRADQILVEATRAINAAHEVVAAGRHLFDVKAIDEINQRVTTALEEVQRLRAAEAETVAAVYASAKARELDQQEAKQALAELQSRIGEVDQRVAAGLDEVQRLQTAEAGTLAAVNANAKARELDQQEAKQALAKLQSRVGEVDLRVAAGLDEVQRLQAAEAETLAAVKEDSQSRAEAQESHDRLLAELQQRVTDIGNGVKLNRRTVWFALAALLVGQVVVAVLAVLA